MQTERAVHAVRSPRFRRPPKEPGLFPPPQTPGGLRGEGRALALWRAPCYPVKNMRNAGRAAQGGPTPNRP